MKIAFVLLLLLISSAGRADEPIVDASKAAQRLLASLTADQRQSCQLQWQAPERFQWHFLPDRNLRANQKRPGLRWGTMRADQQMLTQALLTSALSAKGHRQAMTIVALEQVLHELENKNPSRDPQLYYLAIFGEPSADGTWGWRFEGHHLSTTVTYVAGKQLAVTPQFFGANPGKTSPEHLGGVEAMAAEQHLARALITSLKPEQLTKARFADKAPRDILTGAKKKVGRTDKDWFTTGITAAEMTAAQRQQFDALLRVYTSRFRPELLAKLADGAPIVTDDLRFAWAGGLEPGQGHYYRIVSKRYLIEYANVQNNANHAHTTWRDFDGDFGEDLLQKHYREEHGDRP